MRKRVQFALPLLLWMLTAGCLPYTKIATNNPQFAGDYQKGKIYELQQDVFLFDSHDTYFFGSRMRHVPILSLGRPDPKGSLNSPHEPTSIEEYLEHPKIWRNEIDGVVLKGTRLQFDELFYYWFFEDDTTCPVGIILDGSFKGKTVLLSGISHQPFSPPNQNYYKDNNYLRYLVDTNWLQEVKQ